MSSVNVFVPDNTRKLNLASNAGASAKQCDLSYIIMVLFKVQITMIIIINKRQSKNTQHQKHKEHN